jgi:hypothetical protein
VARQWLLAGGLPVVSALPAEEQRAKEILARHVDKAWGLCAGRRLAVTAVVASDLPRRLALQREGVTGIAATKRALAGRFTLVRHLVWPARGGTPDS